MGALMTDRQRPLIESLAAELSPVPWWRRPVWVTVLWLLVALAFAITSTLLHEPWRVGWQTQLLTTPVVALEIGVAGLGFVVLGWLALQASLPAGRSLLFLFGGALLCWLPWLMLLWIGHEHPALAPSMAGKRETCYLEVMVLSQPITLLGLLLARQLYLLRGWLAGALIGLASGMLVALLMQLACMYLIEHALHQHVAPVFVPTLTGLFGGYLFQQR